MKTKVWLILDCDYLCHRAFYTTGGLSHNDFPTGVVFGFLRDIVTLQQLTGTHRIAFCFDHGKPLRSLSCPTYKESRHQKRQAPLEAEAYNNYRMQVRQLRLKYLEAIGFNNVFYQKGYEADDLIAAVCARLPKKHHGIIISADSDLYQLLSDRISFYNPAKKKTHTYDSFKKEMIDPVYWVDVKAMAGCHTDDVPGIKGIGEKTAIKFLTGRLKSTSDAFHKIVKGNSIWKHNRQVVRLPFPGLDPIDLYQDDVTVERWRKVIAMLGMRSLLREAPLSAYKNG